MCPGTPLTAVTWPSSHPRVRLALDAERRLLCPRTLTGRLMKCFANRELHQDGLAWELLGAYPACPGSPEPPGATQPTPDTGC